MFLLIKTKNLNFKLKSFQTYDAAVKILTPMIYLFCMSTFELILTFKVIIFFAKHFGVSEQELKNAKFTPLNEVNLNNSISE